MSPVLFAGMQRTAHTAYAVDSEERIRKLGAIENTEETGMVDKMQVLEWKG